MTDHLDLQRERAARNQSLFREVNEQIEEIAGDSAFSRFICECMDQDCGESVSVTLEEYEHVRAQPAWFIVIAGHDVAEVEDIVETTDRYLVVEKIGAGAAVAEANDPRRHRSMAESSARNGSG
jgi:hypothetical protein